jgi:branched-chain amino acid transport system ATP-binding protein
LAQLALENVTVRFGGNVAVDDVSLSAEPGLVTAVIGPNGAGKTTLFNVINGLLRPNRGRIRLDDRNVTRLAPHRRARLGLARTFQRLELFSALTVYENVQVATDIRRGWGRGDRSGHDEVMELIDRVGLHDRARARVDQLPTGQARLVELARALATHPKVLLLDEPASGLDTHESDTFGQLLRQLVADGITVLLVEHDVHLVMDVSDQIHVLDFGHIIATGTPDEIRRNEAVLDAYLGAKT